jgi:hypothetical protein
LRANGPREITEAKSGRNLRTEMMPIADDVDRPPRASEEVRVPTSDRRDQLQEGHCAQQETKRQLLDREEDPGHARRDSRRQKQHRPTVKTLAREKPIDDD